MNMYLLEVSMSEKCRSTHFQSEGGSKKFEHWGWGGVCGLKKLRAGGSVPHYMPCYFDLSIDPFHCKILKKYLTKDPEL